MKTPKILYPQTREIYICELDACPTCEDMLRIGGYYNGQKMVQTLTGTREVSYRPKYCDNPDCHNWGCRFGSAQWGHLAPSHCTYGYDVIAHIGWQRQTYYQQFATLHTDLQERGIQISETHVRHLYHQRYLPLLACHERTRWDELQQMSEASGLILSLDGLAPEGGEPQLWVIRELQTGLTLRSGWLSQQDQTTFEHFLRPIAETNLRIAAIMSDKQSGLFPAIRTIFPKSKHGLCQLHYLKNLADPVAEADQTMKVTLRGLVRHQVGGLLRQEQVENPGVLTVTGMIPTALAATERDAIAPPEDVASPERETIVAALLRRVRYLLTLKGRSPFRLAGLEMVARLTEVVDCLDTLINHDPEPRLVQLREGLRSALRRVDKEHKILHQIAEWLVAIANLLKPNDEAVRTGDQVRTELFAYLDKLEEQTRENGLLGGFVLHFRSLSTRYATGLFHTYDIDGLPRTNNDRESEFRDLQRRMLMTTGQKGATRRWLQRSGAWELIPRPDSFANTVTALATVASESFQQERERVRQHRSRFTQHTRSVRQSHRLIQQWQDQWCSLPSRASPG
jgi:hypothetical protein